MSEALRFSDHLGILRCTAVRLILWGIAFLVLPAFPIALHIAAVVVNGHQKALPTVDLADTFLYTFIIAIAAMADAIAEGKGTAGHQTAILITVVVVITTAFCYAGCSLTAVQTSSLYPWLAKVSKFVVAMAVIAYTIYKIPTFYGAGKADWRTSKESPNGVL